MMYTFIAHTRSLHQVDPLAMWGTTHFSVSAHMHTSKITKVFSDRTCCSIHQSDGFDYFHRAVLSLVHVMHTCRYQGPGFLGNLMTTAVSQLPLVVVCAFDCRFRAGGMTDRTRATAVNSYADNPT